MYAVIRAGGKQYKVAKGDVIEVERLKRSTDTVEFTPVLVIDDDGKARFERSELQGAVVSATVIGESKGEKLTIQRFRSKSGYRRRTGHRQKYSSVQISDIKLAKKRAKRSSTKGQEVTDGA